MKARTRWIVATLLAFGLGVAAGFALSSSVPTVALVTWDGGPTAEIQYIRPASKSNHGRGL